MPNPGPALPILDVNSLPEWARDYIHGIESKCDPAGDIRTISELRDTIRALEIEERSAYKRGLAAALVFVDANLVEVTTKIRRKLLEETK